MYVIDSVQNLSTSELYFVSSLNWSTGWIHPASAHSGSQASDTHITSSGALPTNFVTIASRYCAHGRLPYSTSIPVFFSNAVMWLSTKSTAADQPLKFMDSSAANVVVAAPTVKKPATTATDEYLRNSRQPSLVLVLSFMVLSSW